MKTISPRARSVLAIFVAVALLISVGAIWSAASELNTKTARVQTVVDSIETPAPWGKPDGGITPARFACIGDNPCPSAFLIWEFNGTVSPADLQAVLDSADLDFPVLGDCQMDDDRNVWPDSICGASGVKDGAEIDLAVSVDGRTKLTALIVNVELDNS
jgi:hypothetical protein